MNEKVKKKSCYLESEFYGSFMNVYTVRLKKIFLKIELAPYSHLP